MYRWQLFRRVGLSYVLFVVWLACAIVGGKLGITSLIVVAILAGIGQAACLVRAFIAIQLANRAMSQLFGFKVGLGAVNPPPRTTARYLKWCGRNGVRPYSADTQHS